MNDQNNSKSSKWYLIIMSALYGVGILTCLICDFAINKSLTWFPIVLVSIVICFCITNLPFLFKRYGIILSAVAVSGLTFLLLYTCNWFVKGDWLETFAYPLAAYSIAFLWILIGVVKIKRLNWGFKTAILLLLGGIFTLTCNPLVWYLAGDEYEMIDLFVYRGGAANYSMNGIVLAGILVAAVICFITGIGLQKKKRIARSS